MKNWDKEYREHIAKLEAEIKELKDQLELSDRTIVRLSTEQFNLKESIKQALK